MKQFKNLTEIKEGLKEVDSSAAGTDKFIAQCLPHLIEVLESIDKRLKRRQKRLPIR